jgi:iron-sulfur cluster repair protein YtfE (RIC family)
MKVTKILKSVHAKVKALFARFEATGQRAGMTRRRLIDRLATELTVHAAVEEEIFYPAVATIRSAAQLVKEARTEHHQVKTLIADIRGLEATAEEVTTLVRDLRNAVLHHASDEEKIMFPMAEKMVPPAQLERLGDEVKARKRALKPREIRQMLRKAA